MTALQVFLLILCGLAVTLDVISWSGEERERGWWPLYVGWGVVFVTLAAVLWQLMRKAIG